MLRVSTLVLVVLQLAVFLPAQDLLVNRGALIHLQPGALLHVEGDIRNENHVVYPGEFENYGRLALTGDWINNSLGQGFLHRTGGQVLFVGGQGEQQIKGSHPTHFNDLILLKPNGPGLVSLRTYVSSDGTLNLDDDILDTRQYQFFMQNTDPEAILRKGETGQEIMHSTAEGYVRSLPGTSGGLARQLSPDFNGTDYFFPVGSSLRFRPIALSAQLDSSNVYLVRFVDATPPDRLALEDGLAALNPNYHHLIDRRDDADVQESIRIYHDFVEDDICDIEQVAVAWNDGQVWRNLGPANSQHQTPFMSFTKLLQYPDNQATPFHPSMFALAGKYINNGLASCVFPSEFLELNVWAASDHIQLDWETNSEFNNLGFEILRSTNGLDFERIGWRNGIGTTNSPTQYEYLDETAVRYRRYFYRIRQLDQNGFEKFSNTGEAILLGDGEQLLGNFYPNPSKGRVQMWASLPKAGELFLSLYNDIGQEIRHEQKSLTPGYQVLEFDWSSLSSGMYLAEIRLGSERLHRRILID